MATRRHGNIVGYWGSLSTDGQTPITELVQPGEYSRPQYLGQYGGDFTLYLSASAAVTITLMAAHSSQLTSEGSDPGRLTNEPNYTLFYPVWYADVASQVEVQYVFPAGGGNVSLLVPRFTPGWTILKASAGAGANVIAGWEITNNV